MDSHRVPITTRPTIDTAFKQQRLKAWQPLLTPKVVIPTLFAVGAIFLPIGIGLYVASNQVNELMFDYSNCNTQAPASMTPFSNGAMTAWSYNQTSSTCTIQFKVPNDFSPPIFLYYRLTNFYQNHRQYVKSFDAAQLTGAADSGTLQTNCGPLDRNPSDVVVKLANQSSYTIRAGAAQYYPCGLIANSYFSDIIGDLNCSSVDNPSFQFRDGSTCATKSYTFSDNNIAWPTDTQNYKVTDWAKQPSDAVTMNVLPPPFWMKWNSTWANGYTNTTLPNLATFYRFQVWMRTAALPTFRKLYGINSDEILPAGTWQVSIVNNFNTSMYGGTKSIVISTVSILGGKNVFLGAAYIAVALLCWVFAIGFLARQMIKPRKLGDHTYLSWNQ